MEELSFTTSLCVSRPFALSAVSGADSARIQPSNALPHVLTKRYGTQSMAKVINQSIARASGME